MKQSMPSPAQNRPILAVHGSDELQRAFSRFLHATLRPVRISATIEEARGVLDDAPEVVIVDQRVLAGDGRAFLAEASRAGASACIVLLRDEETPPIEFPTSFSTLALSNLIDASGPALEDELVVSVLKLLRQDVFGMEKYLSWRVVPVVEELERAADRRAVVDRMRGHIVEQGLDRRLTWLATQTADELLSNAVFHGPVDDHGVHFRADQPRADDFPLEGRNRVRLRYGNDGRYFCIEVRDQWGSLEPSTLQSCLRRRSPQSLVPKDSNGGAGIGLALTSNYVSHLVCNVEPDRMTELVAIFDVRGPVRAVRGATASFNAFVANRGRTSEATG